MTERLGELLTIAQVARRAGWCCEDRRLLPGQSPPRGGSEEHCSECAAGIKRMRRHLLAQDKQLGGMLLTRVGGGERVRYLVTLGSLERIHPEWFAEAESLGARIEQLETRNDELFGMVRAAHEEIGDLKRAVSALASRKVPA